MSHRSIVLTGGPCGGKTTAMSRIAERLESLGFRVFSVPETPTMLFQGGFSLHEVTPSQVAELETILLRTVINTEESFRSIAEVYGDDCVFLCDRGVMDPKAYVSPEMWQAILSNLGLTEVQLRDQRYDAVIHMVTAADGAENYYTLANNRARTETPEEARVLDKKTQDAWVGHPHLRVVDNRALFDDKVRKATALVCGVVGIPEPQPNVCRFLVASVGDIPVKNVSVDITDHYLVSDPMPCDHHSSLRSPVEERVRKRGREGSYVYTHTVRRGHGSECSAELDRMITPAEHLMAVERRDKSCAPLHKERTCFVWDNRYWALDRYTAWTPSGGGHLTILEVELANFQEKFEVPPFLSIEREVTDDDVFLDKEIARNLARSLLTVEEERSLVAERLQNDGGADFLFPDFEAAREFRDAVDGCWDPDAGIVFLTGKGALAPGLPYVLSLHYASTR